MAYIYIGAEFHTPEALLVRSNDGVGGLSRVFHAVFLEYLVAETPTWVKLDVPIILNTWEALKFDVNHDAVIEMAARAKHLGINLICVDDGWFGKRRTDRTSLGDWVVNREKFPFGLNGLSRELNAMGIKLGLWLEPEMISEDSLVAKLHPDWILRAIGLTKQISRNQVLSTISTSNSTYYLVYLLLISIYNIYIYFF